MMTRKVDKVEGKPIEDFKPTSLEVKAMTQPISTDLDTKVNEAIKETLGKEK